MLQTKRRSADSFFVTFFFIMAVFLDQRWGRIGGVRLELIVSLYCCVLILPLLVITRRFDFRSVWRNFGIFGLLYIAWLMASSLWSIAPQETLSQAFIYSFFLVTLLCFRPIDTEAALDLLLNLLTALAIASWLFYFVAGDLALSPKEVAWRLRGIVDHEQRLAIYMSIAILVLLARILSGTAPQRHRLLMALFVITLFATFARAYMAFTFLLCLGILFFYNRKIQLTLTLMGPLFLIIAIAILPHLLSFFGRGDADLTLTGRTTIWAYAITLWSEQPWLGYGYGSFPEMVKRISIFANYTPPHAHNSAIHAGFETGIIGIVLLSSWILSLLFKRTKNRGITGRRFILLFTLLVGITGIIWGEKINGALITTLMFVSFSLNARTARGDNTTPIKSDFSPHQRFGPAQQEHT